MSKKLYTVLFKDEANRKIVEELGGEVVNEFKNLKRIMAIETDDIQPFIDSPLIESATEEDSDYEDAAQTTSGQTEGYHIEGMGVKKFWDDGYTGAGIKVAIMDTGVQEHEDLILAGGFNAYDNTQPYTHDNNGHGTHVAGIVGMQDNGIGYVGIAPDCELYAIKTNPLNGGGHSRTAQIAGMDWAIENGMDIVNCSWSSSTDSAERREAFRIAAEDHGIIITCSAGNRQENKPVMMNTIEYPSKYPFVVTVANLNEQNERRFSSSCGSEVDITGYGTHIVSTTHDMENPISKKYKSMSGTSMSAPAVAGMVALYKQMHPDLGREELIDLMKKKAKPLGSTMEFGSGLAIYPGGESMDVQMKQKNGDAWENLNPMTLVENIVDKNGKDLSKSLVDKVEVRETAYGHEGYVSLGRGLIIVFKNTRNSFGEEEYTFDTDNNINYLDYPFGISFDFLLAAGGSLTSNNQTSREELMSGGQMIYGSTSQWITYVKTTRPSDEVNRRQHWAFGYVEGGL